MIFATKAFFLFLVAVLVAYHLCARTRGAKYNVLLAASWVFYAHCSPRYLWVIVLLTAVDFVAAWRYPGVPKAQAASGVRP